MSRAMWISAVLVSCYAPTLEPACAVHCDFNADVPAPCPGDYECLASGMCAPHGMTCGVGPDAGMAGDGPGDGGRVCYGQPGGLFRACFTTAPTNVMTFTTAGATIDTGNCALVESQLPTAGPAVCVVAAATIDIETAVTVRGSRALVLVAADTVTIGTNGTLDASSSAGTGTGSDVVHGAGVSASCVGGIDPTATGMAASEGGAGGSFQTAGGPGGGDRNFGTGGGTAGPPNGPLFVRGGCDGGPGYTRVPPGALEAGATGPGGGAVYVIAGNAIVIGGRVDASGGGAPIAFNKDDCKDASGGRGGGTGGLVGLDAPAVTLLPNAMILAIGGGGSSGCNGGGQLSHAGIDGTAGGTGGSAGSANGSGGDGSTGTAAGGAALGGDDLGGGGGGGGGGAGFIFWVTQSALPTIGVVPQATVPNG